ncbi:ANTAR domain-containing protein [Modestobacter italicus]|uniref:ANTAR domain-containing protein n=1 Tax=Modestobacter italicus (strain DSM 44449 / CECT 9708 / BC 501) TaxID=2732864 RepID=UPI001C9588BF|nr:ANTAR domain-containing protein [Modestobacter italicus]
MDPVDDEPCTTARPVAVQLPTGVLRSPSGDTAVVVVRTAGGWTVLTAGPEDAATAGRCPEGSALPLVEAMSLADLVAGELGATPEPDRQARRAARNGSTAAADEPAPDPRDAELTALRRTVAQLEHALAARVSIERAIGVLAERHGSTPREAFEELRGQARSQGRPAADLAAEVLDGLRGRAAVPGQRTTPATADAPASGHRATGQLGARRVQRAPRHPAGEDTAPEVHS